MASSVRRIGSWGIASALLLALLGTGAIAGGVAIGGSLGCDGLNAAEGVVCFVVTLVLIVVIVALIAGGIGLWMWALAVAGITAVVSRVTRPSRAVRHEPMQPQRHEAEPVQLETWSDGTYEYRRGPDGRVQRRRLNR